MTPDSIRSMFDSLAGRYDLLNRVLSGGRDLAWRRKAVAQTRGGRVRLLDLCGGTGDFAGAWERRRRLDLGVVADFSFAMLREARRKNPRVSAVQCDAVKLPFKAGVFGAVTCGFGMRNLPAKPQGLRQAARVLGMGGELVVLEFFRPEGAVSRLFYYLVAPWLVPAVGWVLTRRPSAYRYLIRSIQASPTAGEFAGAVADSGFERVRVLALDGGLAHVVTATAKGVH